MPIAAFESRVRTAAATGNHDELARELNVYGNALRGLGGRKNLLEAVCDAVGCCDVMSCLDAGPCSWPSIAVRLK